MPAQKGFSQVIVVFVVVIAVGLTIFFLLKKQDTSYPVPENHQEQPQQNKNNNQPQGGYGFKRPFYDEDGVSLQHYWPSEGSFSAEETEILLLNESDSNLQVKTFDLSYSVAGKTYPHKSGTWEKFPTIANWDRIEYTNISPQYYKGEQLVLTPGQKGKLHWHIQFGSQPLDGKQIVKVKLTLLQDGQEKTIDDELSRDSGTVFSKDNH